MRVFLPSTLPALAEALRAGQVGSGIGSDADPGQQPGYAVTPALREAYASGDDEELEYAALTEAGRASLRMLAANPAAPPRRVVLAAEIPADQVKLDARDREPARVLVTVAIPIDEAVGTVVTALTATVPSGPAEAPGPANAADPGNAAGRGESTGPVSPSDGTEPPSRIPPATDDSPG